MKLQRLAQPHLREVPCAGAGTCLPSLNREGYHMSPSLEKLALLDDEQLGRVEQFQVWREGTGSITFMGATDVRGLALDELIVFENCSVTVYPRGTVKPPRGFGLNKPALISLHGCFPAPHQEDLCFIESLRAMKNTTFITYTPPTGTWTFVVPHFTRYGLAHDDEEEEEEEGEEEEDMVEAGLDGEAEEFMAEEEEQLEYAQEEEEEELGEEEEDLEEEEELHPSLYAQVFPLSKVVVWNSLSPCNKTPLVTVSDWKEQDEEEYQEEPHWRQRPRLPQQLGLHPRKIQLMKVLTFLTLSWTPTISSQQANNLFGVVVWVGPPRAPFSLAPTWSLHRLFHLPLCLQLPYPQKALAALALPSTLHYPCP